MPDKAKNMSPPQGMHFLGMDICTLGYETLRPQGCCIPQIAPWTGGWEVLGNKSGGGLDQLIKPRFD